VRRLQVAERRDDTGFRLYDLWTFSTWDNWAPSPRSATNLNNHDNNCSPVPTYYAAVRPATQPRPFTFF